MALPRSLNCCEGGTVLIDYSKMHLNNEIRPLVAAKAREMGMKTTGIRNLPKEQQIVFLRTGVVPGSEVPTLEITATTISTGGVAQEPIEVGDIL